MLRKLLDFPHQLGLALRSERLIFKKNSMNPIEKNNQQKRKKRRRRKKKNLDGNKKRGEAVGDELIRLDLGDLVLEGARDSLELSGALGAVDRSNSLDDISIRKLSRRGKKKKRGQIRREKKKRGEERRGEDLFRIESHQWLEGAVARVLADIQLQAGIEDGDCTPEERLPVFAEASAEFQCSFLQLLDLLVRGVARKVQRAK